MKVYAIIISVHYEGCNAPVAICSSRDKAAKVLRKIRHDYENYRIEPGCEEYPNERKLRYYDRVFAMEYTIDELPNGEEV